MGAAIPGTRGKYHTRGANGPVPIPGYLQNSVHASLCANSALLVAVVSLSASARLIGFTHSHPPAGALILAQPAIKVIVTKSVQMGSDFRHPFGPSLSVFECR
jgi:hypothetical protein